MGIYNLETISDDFDIVMEEYNNPIFIKLKDVAYEILQNLPDNASRDVVISHLLYAAEFVKNSIITGRVDKASEIL